MWLALVSSALVPGAAAYDPTHAHLQKVLDTRLAGGRVDYGALHAAPAELDAYLAEVASAPVASMSAAERKALWLNAYNALTIDLVADNAPLASIRDLDGGKVWDTRRYTVGGAQMTLNELEGGLRAFGDPRVHAGLNCASIGCPPLSARVYTAASVEAQLDTAARTWAATATLSGGVLSVSSIFDWYGDDFLARFGTATFDVPGLEGKTEAAANFIATYAPDKAAALRAGGYTVVYQAYDWRVNGR